MLKVLKKEEGCTQVVGRSDRIGYSRDSEHADSIAIGDMVHASAVVGRPR